MQLSHDFVIRKSPFAQRPPNRREYMDDEMARKIFGTIGAHQRCIDISRCQRVREPETFAWFLKCKLFFIDLMLIAPLMFAPLSPILLESAS